VNLSERALQRRLKRYVYKAEHRFLATCAPGFEDVLEGEVRGLEGAKDLTLIEGGVEFSGPFELIYHANLRLRTANRVLWRLAEFLAQSYPMLFDKARKLPWERYLGFAPGFAVKVSAKASRLRHHKKLAATLHSAVLRALEPHGLEPALSDGAPLTIHRRMFEDRCTLSLDTSGELLSRRGYRQATAKAPIRESLAAACFMACNWQDYDLIVDPLCGSGTLIVEAAAGTAVAARVAEARRASLASVRTTTTAEASPARSAQGSSTSSLRATASCAPAGTCPVTGMCTSPKA
jgi:putative N6-adenine-specific DNA methylase